MKKPTLIILAVALIAPAANADDYYFCFTGTDHRLYFAKIPGPGTHDGLDIVHSFPIDGNSDALTYDGENWWMYWQGEIYCFDQNGDYVRSFPRPSPVDVPGLGWDGEYLWINNKFTTYQRDIYGNPGPYRQFTPPGYIYPSSCTVVNSDRLIIGSEGDAGVFYCSVEVFDFEGNHLYQGFSYSNFVYDEYEGFSALAYHDGIVWACYYFYDYDPPESEEIIFGLQYHEGPGWVVVTEIENITSWDLTICDADFINIAEASLGKIKAYFATEEMKGK